jgi:hypothetical protein
MKFRHFLGECDSKEWISPELHCPDTDTKYHLVISLLNLEGITGEEEYHVGVSSVLPEVALAKKEETEAFGDSIDGILGAAWEYGYKAHLWSVKGENPMSLMHQAIKKAIEIAEDFCAYMDEPVNALGWNGWYFAGIK